MKKTLLLCAVLLLALCSFADTSINNFTGYNDGWFPFGDPNNATQTYGEIFTAPDGINNLTSFSFYTGDPFFSGDIIAGAYIATWTGTHAGALLYDSGQFNYDNAGNEELTFNTNGVAVSPGQQYVMFLSTSKFHGESVGATYVSYGGTNQYLDGFAYFNNGRDFESLFFNDWNAYGLQPDWAIDLEFNSVPEPGTLLMLGTGILGSIAGFQRRLF
ncbi:MAG: PEP-CTERM sorting domain-containing protein [Candidatus Korobacteraceae bacterium]